MLTQLFVVLVAIVVAAYSFSLTSWWYDFRLRKEGIAVVVLGNDTTMFIPYADIRSIRFDTRLASPYRLAKQDYQTKQGRETIMINRFNAPRVVIEHTNGRMICTPPLPELFIEDVKDQMQRLRTLQHA